MTIIDGRKGSQDFKNIYDGKRIYCHKSNGLYNVGINGTSKHFTKLDKYQAQSKITELKQLKGFY